MTLLYKPVNWIKIDFNFLIKSPCNWPQFVSQSIHKACTVNFLQSRATRLQTDDGLIKGVFIHKNICHTNSVVTFKREYNVASLKNPFSATEIMMALVEG